MFVYQPALDTLDLKPTFVSVVAWCLFIFDFVWLVGIPIGVRSSAVKLKMYEIIARIKGSKSIIKQKKKKHDLLALIGSA